MSHTLTIKTAVTDEVALRGACVRLELAPPVRGRNRLYDGTEVDGLAVTPRDWKYPAVFTADGTAHYDNYGERWGKQAEFDKLLQSYAVVRATTEARKHGHMVREQQLPDGNVKLTIEVGA